MPEPDLRAHLPHIQGAPQQGTITMIVQRPAPGERRVLEAAELDPERGMVGDRWADSDAPVEAQITLMGQRAIAAIEPDRQRWPLAGDQLIADLDLSEAGLPAGTRLEVGPALLEVTALPHLGCRKYVDRFGLGAMKFVNSPEGRALRLRGVHLRVVRGGRVQIGDPIRRASEPGDS